MDQFYQILRNVQKKERNNSGLARVDETFYGDIRKYIDKLKKDAMSNPFSNAHSILKEAQRIASEICARREHKITKFAVNNMQRSYQLFSSKQEDFDLIDSTPLNLTPEEEKLYYSILDTIKNHKNSISLGDTKKEDTLPIIEVKKEKKPEPKVEPKAEVKKEKKPESKPKVEVKPEPEVLEENVNPEDEFYDFESKKLKKDTELVTMLVFDEVGAIVGVDEKVYGPFNSQDIVTLPLINAKVFFKNRKGRQVKI